MGLQNMRTYGHIFSSTWLSCLGAQMPRSLYKAGFTLGKSCYPYPLLSHGVQRNLSSSKPCNEKLISEKFKEEFSSAFKTIDLRLLKSAPFPALLYGFGGIVPFIAPPLYFISVSFSPLLASAQLTYGATILAFVGGVKWGNALAKNNITNGQIGISTVPSLVAWSALLIPEPLGFPVVSAGLVAALCVDVMSSGYASWFIAMRATLTGIAVTSLMTTFFCVLFH